jgi:hypothetical protein
VTPAVTVHPPAGCDPVFLGAVQETLAARGVWLPAQRAVQVAIDQLIDIDPTGHDRWQRVGLGAVTDPAALALAARRIPGPVTAAPSGGDREPWCI